MFWNAKNTERLPFKFVYHAFKLLFYFNFFALYEKLFNFSLTLFFILIYFKNTKKFENFIRPSSVSIISNVRVYFFNGDLLNILINLIGFLRIIP